MKKSIKVKEPKKKDVKFYYYEIWINDYKHSKIKEEILNEIEMDSTIKILGKYGRNYNFEFSLNDLGQTYARIIRGKPTEDFLYKKEKGKAENLADITKDKNAEVGEINTDIVHFAYIFDKDRIVILIQQGFQYPGVGIFKEFISKIIVNSFKKVYLEKYQIGLSDDELKEFEVKSKLLTSPKHIKPLKKIFNKKIKSMAINLKKNVEIPENTIFGDFLKKVNVSKDYTMKFSVQLSRENKKTTYNTFENVLPNLFGIASTNNQLNELLEIDFPSILSVFSAEFFDENHEVKKEDILDLVENETLNIDSNNLGNSDYIGIKLYENLKNKMIELNTHGRK